MGGKNRMKEETKRLIDKSVKIIESCWDENNPNDNKSFDERLDEKIQDQKDETLKQILIKAKTRSVDTL